MITLLTPLALGGLALLAIPVIVHIFRPRKVRVTPFSSLRWLRASEQKFSRRLHWHQLLLFLVRFLFITALVLAVAGPVISPGRADGFRERVIILNTGATMARSFPDGRTAFENAREAARRLLARLPSGDRTTLIFAGQRSGAAGPPARRPENHLSALERVGPETGESGGRPLTDALPLVAAVLGENGAGPPPELYFLTDNRRGNWRPAEISDFLAALDRPPRVHVVETGAPPLETAWITGARLVSRPGDEARAVRVGVAFTGSEAREKILRVSGPPGRTPLEVTVTLRPGAAAGVDIPVPEGWSLAGQTGRVTLEGPADGEPGDSFPFIFEPALRARVLVIEAESTRIRPLQPGFHLVSALESLAAARNRAFEVVRRAPDDLLAAEIIASDIIFAVAAPGLSAPQLAALEQAVRAGAGLVVFLGPGTDPAEFNRTFHQAQRPRDSLVPVPLAEEVPVAGEDGRPGYALAALDRTDPLLAPLVDPVFGDLRRVYFRSYFRLGTPPETEAIRVPARFDDGQPALLLHRLEHGQVALFNTTAGDRWSDLPRRPVFVPLVARLLDHLGAGPLLAGELVFRPGEAAALTLPAGYAESAEEITVTFPDGRTISPGLSERGGRQVLRLGILEQAGVYRITGLEAFADEVPLLVREERAGAADGPMDSDTLARWWAPADLRVTTSAALETPGDDGRIMAAFWLILLACLLLLTEMYLTHRFCPKMNPVVLAAVSQSSREVT